MQIDHNTGETPANSVALLKSQLKESMKFTCMNSCTRHADYSSNAGFTGSQYTQLATVETLETLLSRVPVELLSFYDSRFNLHPRPVIFSNEMKLVNEGNTHC
ncbi:hypothetical protein RRG08_038082 [Elysia crispata]|uniref:Uncharacterized protein n=1 Tax=Elysia crispata TaxID=231223 RepID=A0AAE0ZY57_9GAST|nr:hypothetical protein RRG08_038082 [Elysia crispata]